MRVETDSEAPIGPSASRYSARKVVAGATRAAQRLLDSTDFSIEEVAAKLGLGSELRRHARIPVAVSAVQTRYNAN